jgi:outer membrane receptor protein involved in Fe transport
VSSGFGAVQHGRYAVVDLAGWVAFGPQVRHRLTARLENALDEAYVTHVSRAFRDSDGSAYLLHYRGVPRTLHVVYSYAF